MSFGKYSQSKSEMFPSNPKGSGDTVANECCGEEDGSCWLCNWMEDGKQRLWIIVFPGEVVSSEVPAWELC